MARTLYRDLFGERFDILPRAIRDMHGQARRAEGRADVTRGGSFLAKLVCIMSGAPASGVNVPLVVTFDARKGGERWTRNFNGARFQTLLRLRKTEEPEVTECFGPLWFRLRMAASEEGVDLVPVGVSFLGAPLPRFVCPRAGGAEREKDGRFHFDVSVRFPLIGDIIRYRGWLVPADENVDGN